MEELRITPELIGVSEVFKNVDEKLAEIKIANERIRGLLVASGWEGESQQAITAMLALINQYEKDFQEISEKQTKAIEKLLENATESETLPIILEAEGI
jgi:Aromatic ring hydroxylase